MAAVELLRNRQMPVEMLKFLVVGGFNFFFTMALFYICASALELNPLLSIAAASIAGLLLTYYLNSMWVFLPDQKLNFRRNFVRYCAANGVSIGVNMVLLHILLLKCDLSAFYAQFILVPFIVLFNFSTAKFWSLR